MKGIAYKKVSGHGSINVPIALRRELNIEAGDAMEVEVTPENEIVIRPYRIRCCFCGTDEEVVSFNKKGICQTCKAKIEQMEKEE